MSRVRVLQPVQKNKTMSKVFHKIVIYCKACYDELAHKTTWPTRTQLTHSAMVVLSASLVIALVVWVMDVVSETIMKFVYPG